MRARGDWVELRPDLWVKQNSDGSVTGRRSENIRASVEAKREMRRAVEGRIAKETEAKETGLRFVGSMSPTVANEMYEKCGNDPEKQRMFIRDNKDLILGIPANSANLPKKRIVVYPKRGRGDR